MTETVGERVRAVEKDIERLDGDLGEIKDIALSNQRMMRWAMGAAAAFGAMVPILIPTIKKALGVG